MIFSGLAITFLSIQEKNIISFILIFLYFIIATLCILSIFNIKKVYDRIQETYWDEDITEEQKKENTQCASRKRKIVIIIERILGWVTLLTIFLSFYYLFTILLREMLPCN